MRSSAVQDLTFYSNIPELMVLSQSVFLVVFEWLTLLSVKNEFAYSVDTDEVAHHEPPHLNLHCLPSNL